MKQAKKNKEYKLEVMQVRQLVYRFREYKDNLHTLVLSKEMTPKEREVAFYLAIRT